MLNFNPLEAGVQLPQGISINDILSSRRAKKLFSGSGNPLEWLLVGGGEKTSPLCGENQSHTIECPSGGSGHTFRRITIRCHDLFCPECYKAESWVLAKEENRRFQAIQNNYFREGYDLFDLLKRSNRDAEGRGHLVLSPPKELYPLFRTYEGFVFIKEIVRKICDALGVIGGIIIVHQFRGRLKYMDAIRNGSIEPQESWHFHIECIRNGINIKSQEFYDATGWVYKWLGNYNKKGAVRNYVGRLAYEIGHAAMFVKDGHKGHVATWFGIMAYNNAKKEEIVTFENEKCCKCGRNVVHKIDGDIIDEVIHKHVRVIYRVTLEKRIKNVQKYALVKSSKYKGYANLEDVLVFADLWFNTSDEVSQLANECMCHTFVSCSFAF